MAAACAEFGLAGAGIALLSSRATHSLPGNSMSPHAQRPAVPSAGSAAVDPARILVETARQLGSCLEPEAIYERVKRSVSGAMPCNGLIVSSFDRGTKLIHCAYAWVGGN